MSDTVDEIHKLLLVPLLIIIGIISFVFCMIFVFLVEETINIEEINSATTLCTDNGGVHHIEYDAANYSDVTCQNGAVFVDYMYQLRNKQ